MLYCHAALRLTRSFLTHRLLSLFSSEWFFIFSDLAFVVVHLFPLDTESSKMFGYCMSKQQWCERHRNILGVELQSFATSLSPSCQVLWMLAAGLATSPLVVIDKRLNASLWCRRQALIDAFCSPWSAHFARLARSPDPRDSHRWPSPHPHSLLPFTAHRPARLRMFTQSFWWRCLRACVDRSWYTGSTRQCVNVR